jgi:hypothetical protein
MVVQIQLVHPPVAPTARPCLEITEERSRIDSGRPHMDENNVASCSHCDGL